MSQKYKHHIFMGSYSADHWIEMIFSGKIILPEYQRTFSWKWEEEGKLFYDTLKEGGYVPPVTLGEYNNEINLIDGQQRLTTLLCLKYKIWPKLDKVELIASADEDDENEIKPFTEFDFKVIQDHIKDKKLSPDEYIKEMTDGDGRRFDYIKDMKAIITEQELNDFSLKDIHIPYTYITWDKSVDRDEQARFYSKTYNTINTGGKKLSNKAVRLAEYWYHKDFGDKIYNKEFEDKIIINGVQLDYIEYLSFALSNDYHLLYGVKYNRYGNYLEQYLLDFIEYLTKDDVATYTWNKESKNNVTKQIYEIFQKEFAKLKVANFISVIDADYYLFGLIYHVYNGFKINDDEIELLKSDLNKKIESVKEEKDGKPSYYTKQPNAKKYIRERLGESKEIWGRYMIKRDDNA